MLGTRYFVHISLIPFLRPHRLADHARKWDKSLDRKKREKIEDSPPPTLTYIISLKSPDFSVLEKLQIVLTSFLSGLLRQLVLVILNMEMISSITVYNLSPFRMRGNNSWLEIHLTQLRIGNLLLSRLLSIFKNQLVL